MGRVGRLYWIHISFYMRRNFVNGKAGNKKNTQGRIGGIWV